MLRSMKDVIGYAIKAKDGDTGRITDFYFDDERWVIRYMVTDIGTWMRGKSVLVSTAAFSGSPDWDKKEFPVNLTREMVKDCPDIDSDKPVSRQKEEELHAYYSWPVYWQQAAGFSGLPMPVAVSDAVMEKTSTDMKNGGNSHLRSFKEVAQYKIVANDGVIGQVEDFIADDERWGILYMAADTNGWLPRGKVLVALNWIKDISWDKSEVFVDLSMEQVKNSPAYDPSNGVNREYEDRIYDYYGRKKYW